MTKRIIYFLILCVFMTGFVGCRVKENLPIAVLHTEYIRNGRVALYAAYDKSSEQQRSWTQFSIYREKFEEFEFRMEHTSQTNQEFRQIYYGENPVTTKECEIFRIETPAEDEKEMQDSSKIEKTLVYRGIKKGDSFYTYNKTHQPDTKKRVYVGDQCFERDYLPYIMCSFPFGEKASVTLRWVNSRVPRQEETTENVTGITTVLYLGEETVKAKGKEYDTYKLQIPILSCTAWYTKDAPHIPVRIEYPTTMEVLLDWNEI